ncbi:MAG: autotransporter outer membrane beta-barrel domain-containing protein [Gammaproteobacteria bacterium]|nr:autotransporter outer membrane beta-barrel domain-containing protein [Gammaproteobacteria bacterium]
MTRIVAGSLPASILSLCLVSNLPLSVRADQEETDTGLTGTDAADVIEPGLPLSAVATVITDTGEKVSAAATGIDAKDGDDSITSTLGVDSNATATALLTQEPDETEANATSTAIKAGDGNDTVDNDSIINALGASTGGYADGAILEFQQIDPLGDDKEVDVSITTKTEMLGVDLGDGNDTLENDGILTTNGFATTGNATGELNATVRESAEFKSTSASEATGTGIQGGGGNDTITNNIAYGTTTTATSGALAVGLTAPGDTLPKPDKDANITTEAKATSKAEVTGIHGDEAELENENKDSSAFGLNGLQVTYDKTVSSPSGDDTITNNGFLTGNATATSGAGSGSVSVQVDGSVETKATAESEATGSGVNGGGGSDTIDNNGELLTTATATSGSVAVAVEIGAKDENGQTGGGGSNGNDNGAPKPPTPSKDKESKSSTDATAKAKAEATGITADGDARSETTSFSAGIDDNALVIDYQKVVEYLEGNDTVSNDFALQAFGTATAGSGAVGVTIASAGSAEAKANAEADSYAGAISTGFGNDIITNLGLLTTESNANATAVSVGVAVGQPVDDSGGQNGGGQDDPPTPASPDKITSKTENNATAKARASGIDADGPGENETTTGSLSLGVDGLEFGLSRDKAKAAGTDTVTNEFGVTVNARAGADSVDASIQIDAVGSVNSEAKAVAEAEAVGVATGAGGDTITNSGVLLVGADADADSVSFGLSASKPPAGETPGGDGENKKDKTNVKTDASATATANAIGIDAEGKDHLNSTAAGLEISGSGLNFQWSQDKESLGATDTVTNTGAVTATAYAESGAVSLGIAINADGSIDAEANSKANATSSGVLTGGGGDTIDNQALVGSSSTATATALGVTVGVAQPTDETGQKPTLFDKIKERFASANSQANAEATARSSGIDSEGDAGRQTDSVVVDISAAGLVVDVDREFTSAAGDDDVTNSGDLTASATALTLAGAADVKVNTEGTASSETNAKSKAEAGGVLTGGGADDVTNSGTLAATADATAGAVSISFTQPSGEAVQSKAESKSDAQANATGIATDDGRESALSTTDVSIGPDGIITAYSNEESANAANDTVNNAGAVSATALTLSGAGAGAGAVDLDGPAKADAKAKSVSRAVAVDVGGGDDFIDTEGQLTASADAISGALAVAVNKNADENSKGKAEVEAGATAESTAVGIAGDSGENRQTDINLSITRDGLAGSYANEKFTQTGDDEITNRGGVDAEATSTAGAAGVAIAIEGSASSTVNVSAKSDSKAIEAGGGADFIDNSGTLTADSDSIAATLSVAVTTDGNATTNIGLMDGGNKAEASAVGIDSAGQSQDSTLVSGAINFDDIGVEANYTKIEDTLAGDGIDEIINSGDVTATSSALAPEVAAGITGEGVALSIGRTSAEATASAIEAGNLGDSVDNSGHLTAAADAEAILANVAVAGKGLAIAANSVWDGGTKAEAAATGIDADSGAQKTTMVDAKANSDVAYVRYTDEYQAAAGNDEVTNTGQIDASAFALAPSLSVAVDLGQENKTGIAAAVSTSTAEAKTNAIRGGDGDDTLDNSGLLNATADANAVSANVAVVNQGVAAAADAVWDGGTKAEAEATGIAGDGGDRTRNTRLSIGTNDTSFTKETVAADGVDDIDNTGEINADATANAGSVGVAVAAKGVGVATSTATADSTATAIDAGAGASTDDVFNSGQLSADSTARAAAASVSVTNGGVALSFDSVWDGGTGATATARGIDLGEGGETLTNEGEIGASADAETLSASIAVSMKGVAGASATSSGKADAVAIDASGGDDVDTVTNSGELTADALSIAAASSISVTNQGLSIATGAVWDGGTGSEATARGIDVGDGADVITNTNGITATSDAIAAEAAVGVSVQGVAGASATSSGDAEATAIHAGDEDNDAVDTVTNSGRLVADAESNAATATVAVTNQGVALAAGAVWDGGTGSDAKSRGIETGGGADVINNTGDVDALSTARVAELSTAVAVQGVAGAIATSTGEADAVAIDAGSGDADDEVFNSGTLVADADAIAATAAVSVTTAGVAVAGGATWDGGTTATADAQGIAVGEGSDDVTNDGDMTITADAKSAEAAVGVAVSGVAGATATATGDATAIGINAGDGNAVDTVTNTGDLVVESDALSIAAAVSVTTAGVGVAGGEVWDGGTEANTKSTGIAVGEGGDEITNSGLVDVHADSKVAELAVSVAIEGASGASASSTGTADATAIDAGAGDYVDTITNTGTLDAEADALATAAAVAVTKFGVSGTSGGAVWDGGTTGDARARGIDGGSGGDTVDNEGSINADADAIAASAAVSVTVAGVAGSINTSTAEANASGIDVSQGDDEDSVTSSGNITAASKGLANTATAAVTPAGVAIAADAIWDGGTSAATRARAVETGLGADDIVIQTAAGATEDIDVSASTLAEAASASVAVTVGGVAGAVATSTAEADAVGLDAGEGEYDDVVTSDANLTADSTAIAASAAVSFAGFGVAVAGNNVWDGGTTAVADATSIEVGAGDDDVTSTGAVTTDSVATATGISASVTAGGVGGAITAANATADSTAIDLGAGDDDAETSNTIDVTSVANANTISVAGATYGVAVAGNNAWDGGTTAVARSSGIDAGSGVDEIDNSAAITTNATTVAPTLSVAYTTGGVAAAVSTATGDAAANAIEGGDDADRINSTGDLDASADAVAVAANLALTGVGVAGGADAVWDGGTVTRADARAISGGTGNDTITSGEFPAEPENPAPTADEPAIPNTVNATANSTTVATTAAITGAGVSIATTTATADADGHAIDGGLGNDEIRNASNLQGEANASATAVSLTVTGVGVGVAADSVWDGGTTASARASGISGGEGSDLIRSGDVSEPEEDEAEENGPATMAEEPAFENTVTAIADADAVSVGVSLTGVGVSASTTTSTANADASAIDGGVGDDDVRNASDIMSIADADASAVAASVTGAGVAGAFDSVWDGGTKANATAAGITGGDGIDSLVNTAEVTSVADADTLSVSAAATLTGMAGAAAASTATGRATGLDGGAGEDSVTNESSVYAKSLADGEGVSVAAVLDGIAVAGLLEAGTTADSQAIGLAGGDARDIVTNAADADIRVESQAKAVDTAVAVSLRGIAAANSNAETFADAAGLSGGAGNDDVINDGTITTVETAGDGSVAPGAVTADSRARAISIALVGGGIAQADANATATTSGLRGGEGQDLVDNKGEIDLAATAKSRGQALAVSGVGAAVSDASATSTVGGSALEGGDGVDTLVNSNTVTITNTAITTTRSISVAGVGASIGSADSVANASAGGASGGEGNDTILNTASGVIDVDAKADVVAQNVTVSVAGLADGSAKTLTLIDAAGLAGDAGDDMITNEGAIAVNGESRSLAEGASASAAGDATARAGTEVETRLAGIDGGDGGDRILNKGNLQVGPGEGEARWMATLEASSSSSGFAGAFDAQSSAFAATDAIGVDGGNADDDISNEGDLRVLATALNTTNAGSSTAFGTSEGGGLSGAVTAGGGLSGGTGNDKLQSGGTLEVEAESRLEQEGTSNTFAGTGEDGAELTASTAAVGMSGGVGDDCLHIGSGVSDGCERIHDGAPQGERRLVVNATSTLDQDGTTSTFAGTGEAAATLAADTVATGMSGDEGADRFVVDGSLEIEARSNLVQNGGTTSFAGTGDAGATLAAETVARGVSGGAGEDRIVATGAITITAQSTLVSRGDSDTVFGTSDVNAETGAITRGAGIDGGDADDEIDSAAELTLNATSTLTLNSSSYTFGGTGESGNSLAATSEMDGILGGQGDDRIYNSGDISIESLAKLDSVGESEATFGTSSGNTVSGGIVKASGLRGGAGDDEIANRTGAQIDITATADVSTESIAYTFGGGSTAASVLTGDAEVVGITGDAGGDTLENAGDISLSVTANLKSDGGSETSIGGSSAVGTSEAAARAIGMDGGDDDDILTNTGAIDIDVTVVADAVGNAESGVFVGDAETGAVTVAKATATGLSTGEGNDELTNSGLVLVEADATGYALGYASGQTISIGNTSTSVGRSTAEATAVGIVDGDDASTITNENTLDVKATARTAKALETAFRVYRLQGQNSEEVEPDSDLIPEVVLELPDFNENDPETGQPNSEKYPLGTIVYCTGGGAECVPNTDVNRKGNYHEAVVAAETDEFSWQYDGTTDPAPAPSAFLPDLSDPDNQAMYPDGTILYCTDTACSTTNSAGSEPFEVSVETIITPGWQVFAAVEDLPDLDDPANQALYPEGTVVACQSTGCTRDPGLVGEDAEAAATYYEVNVTTDDSEDPPVVTYSWQPFDGRDVDGMRIEGLEIQVVTVAEADSFPSYAAANGNGLGGTGNATGNSRATATAWGMRLGDARDDVTNTGLVNVTATAEAVFAVAADGDNFGDATGKAFSFGAAAATGFELGDGDNVLWNNGDITVLAQPTTQSFAEASGGDICIWFFGWWCGGGGDGIGTAEATLVADARGITSGDGADTFTNEGEITVTAAPLVRTDNRKGEFVADVRQENSETINVFVTSRAIGIETGAGDDDVTNTGEVTVLAKDLLSGCSNQACVDFTKAKGIDSSVVEAAGILTGDGNDTLRNNGVVSAQILIDGERSDTVAIDLGAGDDTLYLGDEADITGSVTLGEGDDMLELSGTPTITHSNPALVNPAAAGGVDTLMLNGAGAFAGSPTGFERAGKIGAGTYQLPGMDSMRHLTVDEGTLALDSDYEFAADGEYVTAVYTDGRFGQLSINGDTSLDGDIEVEKRGDTFVRGGTRYDLIEATGAVTDAFATMTLPEPTPLLRFELDQDADSLGLEAVAEPFEKVATNPMRDTIARNLNGVARNATGDFAEVLGRMQSMQDGFDRAFQSLSPDSHQVSAVGSASMIQQTTSLLQSHLRMSRGLYRGTRRAAPSLGNVGLSLNSNGEASVGFNSGPHLAPRAYTGEFSGGALAPAMSASGPTARKPNAQSRSQAWLLGLMSKGKFDEVDGYTAFDQDTGAFALGYDFRLGERWLVGASVGKAETEIDMFDAFAEGDIEGWYGSLYGSWFTPRHYIEFGASYTDQDIDNRRLLEVGGLSRIASSSHKGDVLATFAGAGMLFEFDAVYIEPYATLQYVHFDEKGFTETGAGSLNQIVAARSTDALFGETGATLGRSHQLGDGELDWHLSAGLNYDFDIDDARISYSYAGAPGTVLQLEGRQLGETSGVFGAGVAWSSDRIGLSLDYLGRFNSDYDEQSVGAFFTLRF